MTGKFVNPHRLTWTDRLWIRWHEYRHDAVYVSATISVPSFDPGARGVLCECACGKGRAR